MDEEEEKKIDPFDPLIVVAFIIAFFGDLSFFLVITHWIAGIVVLIILWPRFRGWLPKLNFALCVLIPLPVLMIGILQGILLSNKFVAFLTEQVAIQAIAIGTGGLGEGLEAGALAGEGAELAAETAEAAEAVSTAGTATETAAGVAEGGEATTAAAEGTAEGAEGAEATEEGDETVSEKIKRKLKEKARDQLSGGGAQDQDDEGEDQEAEQEISDDQRRKIESEVDYEQAVESGTQLSPIEEAEQKDFAIKQSSASHASDEQKTELAKFDPRLSEKNRLDSQGFAERQKKAQERNRQTENLREPQIKEINAADASGDNTTNKDNDIRRAA